MIHNRRENEIVICDKYAIIICKNKQFGIFESKIDIEDIPKVEKYYWSIRYDRRHPKHYIETFEKGKRIHLHRYLLDLKTFNFNNTVDHMNGDSLDNRKCNLRICTQAENMQNLKISKRNKAGVKYITWSNTFHKWLVSYKQKYIGVTKDLEEAKQMLRNYFELNNLNVA